MTSGEPNLAGPAPQTELEIALLTGGWDKPYAFGLASALSANGVRLDLVGNDDLMRELRGEPRITGLAFRQESAAGAGVFAKVAGILTYYVRLIRYALTAKPRIFHILWNNKFETFDRVALMLYYRALGKKIVLTAHNVNAGTRDANDTFLNRLTLKTQYALSDHIFVHTDKMKDALVEGYGVRRSAVTVVRFGINNSVPQTTLTPAEARERLGISAGERTILFFGNIAPYKGLEYLISAFQTVATKCSAYRLLVAGRPKKGFESYWDSLRARLDHGRAPRVTLRIEYVPDEETELYFKAADVLALPYTSIFQSGVLFLGYSFGLPVLAADVGSLKDDVITGETGYVFAPCDADDLAEAIETYFSSELFANLDGRRKAIRDFANARYSWDAIGDASRQVYAGLLPSPISRSASESAAERTV